MGKITQKDKMKDKIITIKPKGITQKQWVNFLLAASSILT